jgi:hypothetical protein
VLSNSYLHNMGFNCDAENRVGSSFANAKDIYILNNTIARVSHNGFQFSFSASSAGSVSTGSILVRGNVWSQACCSNADCGCLKFWSPPESHIWKDVLVTENLCQSTFGWTRPSWERQMWSSPGFGGFGWYTDHYGSISWFKNIAYNVASTSITMYKYWEDSNNYIYNNLLIGSGVGFSLGGQAQTQTGTTEVKNNIFIEQAQAGFVTAGSGTIDTTKIKLDSNLYWNVSWSGKYWRPIVLQDSAGWNPLDWTEANSRNWELTKYTFNPQYPAHVPLYNFSDPASNSVHQYLEFPQGVFGVTDALVDKGTASLPTELVTLLNKFGLCYQSSGASYDLGPFEKNSPCTTWMPKNGQIAAQLPDNGDDTDNQGLDSSRQPGLASSITCSVLLTFFLSFLALF